MAKLCAFTRTHNYSLLALTLAVIECSPLKKKHAKRFAGFNIAAIGGSAGCVVTGNKLFANGFFLRDLTPEEQSELKHYETESKKYKEEVKLSLEEKRKEWQATHKKSKATFAPADHKDLPKPPKKPSFCSAVDTTQYYFDGCMVQNNKVYVGREYARDLTPDEVKELKEFDAKMSAYQQYLAATIQQQVDGLFGGKTDFWSLFTDHDDKKVEATTHESAVTTTIAPVEAPPTPNFCVAIY